jgi:hypothetical protein
MQREALVNAGWYPPGSPREMSVQFTTSRKDIRDTESIKVWRYDLLELAIDMSHTFPDVHKVLHLNTEDEKDAWAAACDMDDHYFFRDNSTSFTPTDTVSFVKRRLTFVVRCLKCIQGASVPRIHEMYIDPWILKLSAM